MDYLQRKVNVNPSDLVGTVNTPFDYDRSGLIKSIGNSATQIITSYDKTLEAQKLSQEMKAALVGTAAVEVSALGLGTIFAVALLDITGKYNVHSLYFLAWTLCHWPKNEVSATSSSDVQVLWEQVHWLLLD